MIIALFIAYFISVMVGSTLLGKHDQPFWTVMVLWLILTSIYWALTFLTQ